MSGEIILYNTEDGRAQLRRGGGGHRLAEPGGDGELFQTTNQIVSLHIRNILGAGDLTAEATVKESLTV